MNDPKELDGLVVACQNAIVDILTSTHCHELYIKTITDELSWLRSDLYGILDGEEIKRIINRHIARLLCNLEEANCPFVFCRAVKDRLFLLRNDISC